MGNTYQVRTVTQNGVGLPTSGGIIKEEHINDELTTIIAAFNATTGHSHNGTDSARVSVIGPAGQYSTDANAFFATSSASVGLGKTGNVWKDLHIDNVVIDGSTISTIGTNTDLTITPVGTGSVVIAEGDLKIGSTAVTSTAAELNILDGKSFLDEDDMASDSATGIASQQSIKAYVDSQVTAQDLDGTADSGTFAIDLDSQALAVTGGTGIDTSATNQAVTVAIDSTVATLAGTQALTNKTLTAPVFGGISTTASGNLQVKPATNILEVQGNGSDTEGQIQLNCHANSHGQVIKSQPHSESVTNTMLLPKGGNSTLVSEIGTQTLTNKTLTSPKINENVVMSSTATELNILDGATVSTTELNLIDGDTARGTDALADGDGILINDNGTMKMTNVQTVRTYMTSNAATTGKAIAMAMVFG
tara:strand:- start:886 stop:2145 length:1260 start_codon:yes stop_codon:yes gene_type:complete